MLWRKLLKMLGLPMSNDLEFDMGKITQEFLAECAEMIDLVIDDVLTLEKTNDPEVVGRVFRTLHTIKGNSSMMGFCSLSEFVHTIENTFHDIRTGKRTIDKLTTDSLLKGFDIIRDALDFIRKTDSDGLDYANGFAIFKDMNSGTSLSRTAPPECFSAEVTQISKSSEPKGQVVTLDDLPTPSTSSEMIESERINKMEAAVEILPSSCIAESNASLGASSTREISSFIPKNPFPGPAQTATFHATKCQFTNPYRSNENTLPAYERNAGDIKALVVDDDFTNRRCMQGMLNPFMVCHIAKDGTEAIQAVAESYSTTPSEPYDLIVLDIMMPNIDGLQAAKAIRQIEQGKGILPGLNEAKIFIASALDDDATMLKAIYECGANAYLIKPIDKNDLYRQLVLNQIIAPRLNNREA